MEVKELLAEIERAIEKARDDETIWETGSFRECFMDYFDEIKKKYERE